ncbi:MAG: hypothetical protein IK115_06160 [Lachnospiraceae bacterium]|nr:hypothetical protein [Lachnospiraceae bacterium]
MGLRKHENYIKDAVEGIFEYIRISEYASSSVSRIGCVYYCETKEEAIKYLKDDCIDNGDFTVDQVRLLEAEVEDSSIYRYDQAMFNEASELMEKSRDLEKVKELARKYYSGEWSDKPLIEILADGENRIIRDIPIE